MVQLLPPLLLLLLLLIWTVWQRVLPSAGSC